MYDMEIPWMQVGENRKKNWKRKKVVSLEFMGHKFRIPHDFAMFLL